jgi:hypothetical protein
MITTCAVSIGEMDINDSMSLTAMERGRKVLSILPSVHHQHPIHNTSTHSLPINPPTTLNQPPNQPTNTFKMQFTNFAFVAFAAFASAAAIDKRAVLCGSANSTPQCCETSVLGVATLSCAARK